MRRKKFGRTAASLASDDSDCNHGGRHARRTRGNCKVFRLLATNPMKRREQAAWENSKGHLCARPITDLDGKIENPFEPGTTLNKAIETADRNH